jgi:hypothetical protein
MMEESLSFQVNMNKQVFHHYFLYTGCWDRMDFFLENMGFEE